MSIVGDRNAVAKLNEVIARQAVEGKGIAHRDVGLTSIQRISVVTVNPSVLLTVDELSAHSKLSLSTIHRLKRAGRIPYFQPAGKGGRLLFPLDAIEQSSSSPSREQRGDNISSPNAKPLSGPRPKWQRP